MLHDRSLVKENCGFGLIAHLEGQPSHKVVRTAILGLSRMQHRGAILSDEKQVMVVAYSYKCPNPSSKLSQKKIMYILQKTLQLA